MKKIGLLFCLLINFTAALSLAKGNALPAELLPVQKNLFEHAFISYANDLKNAHPEILSSTEALGAPDFDPALERNEWQEKFDRFIAQKKSFTPEQSQQLHTITSEMFFSYYQNVPYMRVAFLARLPEGPLTSDDLKPKSVEVIHPPTSYPVDHTLDVKAYVNERFPQVLQDFIRSQKVALFIHDSSCADMIALQRAQGFSVAFRFMGQRDGPDSYSILFHHPKQSKYRFGICDSYGEDDLTRIQAILGPVFQNLDSYLVHHLNRVPLFKLNAQGKSLKMDPQLDRVVMGFQNTIWWQLKNSSENWERQALTDGGTDASLFYNRKTKQQILSLANVYGDEMKEALQVFYAKGARRFAYVGTAGVLNPQFEVGDALIPNLFILPDGKKFASKIRRTRWPWV